MSFYPPEAPLPQEVTDEQLYEKFYNAMRESINNALWGYPDQLRGAIAQWQFNFMILPEDTKDKLINRLKHDMGIE